jgi:hypothetical protein
MENFNSLGIFMNGSKINSLNKLCRQLTPIFWQDAKLKRIGAKPLRSSNSGMSLAWEWNLGAFLLVILTNGCNKINMAGAL